MSRFRLQEWLSKFKRGVTLLILLSSSSILILFSGTPGVLRPEEIGFSIFSFFQGSISSVVGWFGDTFNSINELRVLREEYEAAKTQLSYYEGLERSLVELRTENKVLRENLSFSQSLSYKHIPAEIIAKEPSNTYSSFTISKGYISGIRENMPVIGYQDGIFGLVGRISEVGLSSAIVQPITDSSNYISARMQNSRYEGLVVGQGSLGDDLLMQFVKKRATDEVKFGDLVITSGMRSLYPKGLYIGRVKNISAKEYETSLTLELETVISLSKLEFVYVIQEDLVSE